MAIVSVYWTPSSCDVTRERGEGGGSEPHLYIVHPGASQQEARAPLSPRRRCQPSPARWCANNLNSPIKGGAMFHTREGAREEKKKGGKGGK